MTGPAWSTAPNTTFPLEIGENLAFYGGFNKLFQIECDFGQTHYKQYNKEALDSFRSKQLLLEKSDEYWQPKAKISRREKKQQKKLKQKQEKLGKILQEITETKPQTQPETRAAAKKRRKRTNRCRRSSAPQTKKKKTERAAETH